MMPQVWGKVNRVLVTWQRVSSVSYGGPTAVTLGSVQASPAAGAALPLAGALLALFAPLAVAAGMRRRYV